MYGVIKAVHVSAMVCWIGGTLVASLLLNHNGLKEYQFAVLRRVMTPGMLLTWGAGILLAQHAAWFSASWLQLKLVLVVFLSAVHGILLGKLRKQIDADSVTRPIGVGWRLLPWAVIGSVFCISLLAIFKPMHSAPF